MCTCVMIIPVINVRWQAIMLRRSSRLAGNGRVEYDEDGVLLEDEEDLFVPVIEDEDANGYRVIFSGGINSSFFVGRGRESMLKMLAGGQMWVLKRFTAVAGGGRGKVSNGMPSGFIFSNKCELVPVVSKKQRKRLELAQQREREVYEKGIASGVDRIVDAKEEEEFLIKYVIIEWLCLTVGSQVECVGL